LSGDGLWTHWQSWPMGLNKPRPSLELESIMTILPTELHTHQRHLFPDHAVPTPGNIQQAVSDMNYRHGCGTSTVMFHSWQTEAGLTTDRTAPVSNAWTLHISVSIIHSVPNNYCNQLTQRCRTTFYNTHLFVTSHASARSLR